jgi:EmrB/QacA subfamily drug resistance transporter
MSKKIQTEKIEAQHFISGMKGTSPWLALVIVLMAPLLSVVDTFIINVAIPSIKKGVHATDAQVQLVIAGYLLGYASFLITGGRAGDHFGRKKVFFWGMLVFTIISCLCGLANTPLELNVTRFFQGVSASFMVPQSIAFIQLLFPDPKERSKAIGYYGITLGLASIIGQVLGGYFSGLHTFVEGWRLIFFINLPIGIAALLATHHYLPETEKHGHHVFDYSGIFILTIGLFLLIIPLILGREAGWPLWSFVMLTASVGIFVVLIVDQHRKRRRNGNPLIDVELFRNKEFNIGLLAVLFQFMAHTSYLLTAAVFFQNGLGYTALQSGLFFAVPGLLFTFSSVVASRLVPKYGKVVLQVGVLIIVAAFSLQILLFKPQVSVLLIYVLMGSYGLGNGLILSSLVNIALKNVPHKFAGAASGVYSTTQVTASALGVSIIGGIFFFVIKKTSLHIDYVKAFDYATIGNITCLVLVWIMLSLLPKTKNKKDVEIAVAVE